MKRTITHNSESYIRPNGLIKPCNNSVNKTHSASNPTSTPYTRRLRFSPPSLPSLTHFSTSDTKTQFKIINKT